MMALCKSKFFDGIQHHLYEILPGDDWGEYPWGIPCDEYGQNKYWLPVMNK